MPAAVLTATAQTAARSRAAATRTSVPSRRERRIARGLRDGDPEALRGLHDEIGGTVFGYLVGTLGDRGAAEDVFQQVFTEAWTRGPSYDERRASLLTWVMTIARSRAIDELRRRRPEPREDARELADLAADPAASPDALADRWQVAHLLAALPDDEQQLLRLRFYGELSQSEIAHSTGMPLGTVKTRMVRALERLRHALAEEERDAEAVAALREATA